MDLAYNIKKDRKKVDVLISTVGCQTYKLLKDLCSPDKPNTKCLEKFDYVLTKPFTTKANKEIKAILRQYSSF